MVSDIKRITIIGATGFLGSQIKAKFSDSEFDICLPKRSDLYSIRRDLGVVIYAAG